MAEPINMWFMGLICVVPRNCVLKDVEISHRKEQFLGLSDPLKSIESLSAAVYVEKEIIPSSIMARSERSHSILNNTRYSMWPFIKIL